MDPSELNRQVLSYTISKHRTLLLISQRTGQAEISKTIWSSSAKFKQRWSEPHGEFLKKNQRKRAYGREKRQEETKFEVHKYLNKPPDKLSSLCRGPMEIVAMDRES